MIVVKKNKKIRKQGAHIAIQLSLVVIPSTTARSHQPDDVLHSSTRINLYKSSN